MRPDRQKLVAEAAGSEVTNATLSGAVEGKGGLATLSTCTYKLANGASLSVLARQSPVPDFTPEAVEKARTAGGMMPAAEDVDGLGRAALWTKETNGLQIFIDDTRYVAINLVGPGTDAKAVATKLGSKLV